MSTTIIRGGRVIDPRAGLDDVVDVLIEPGRVVIGPKRVPVGATELDAAGLWVLPGLIDLQVHFREPGQTHKEDLATGGRAAVAGGVTSVVIMPNTRPVLDDPQLVYDLRQKGGELGLARIYVAAAATRGSLGKEISDYAELSRMGAVAVTDDGLPILDDDVMRKALAEAARCDLLVMQHAEDTRITHHVPMTECDVSHRAHIEGQPPEAESNIVERDIAFAEEMKARYHVLHLSTKKSLAAVRAAKARAKGQAKGVSRISCEVSPHHLLLTHDDVVKAGGGVGDVYGESDLDPNRKMNPPLRSREDRDALVQGLIDGTVDAVATDHAPHSDDEKGQGFVKAPFGVTGLETMLAALMTFVHDGTIDARRAVELVTSGPAHVLRREDKMGTLVGKQAPADLCVVDPNRAWTVDRGSLLSRSKNSGFLGRTLKGRVVATFVRGQRVFDLVDARGQR